MEPCYFSLPQGIHLCIRHFEGNKNSGHFWMEKLQTQEEFSHSCGKLHFLKDNLLGIAWHVSMKLEINRDTVKYLFLPVSPFDTSLLLFPPFIISFLLSSIISCFRLANFSSQHQASTPLFLWFSYHLPNAVSPLSKSLTCFSV